MSQPPADKQPQEPEHKQPPHEESDTIIEKQVKLVPHVAYRTFPVKITCPKCKTNAMTDVAYKNGLMVSLASGLMIMNGCWFGCCLVPYWINSLKDVVHSCSNCKNIVGTYKRA